MDRYEACQRAYDRLMPEDIYGYPDYAKEDARDEAEANVDRLREEARQAFPGDWDPVDDDASCTDCLSVLVRETMANWPDDLAPPDPDDLWYYAALIGQLRAAKRDLADIAGAP